MGVRNGHLHYNRGSVLLQAGEPQRALRDLLLAECYLGRDPDVQRNLQIAAERLASADSVALPWYRPLLFWHYNTGAPVRVWIAVTAFAAFWVGLVLRVVGAPRLGKRIVVLALIAFALFGSSVATSLHQAAAARPAIEEAVAGETAPPSVETREDTP
jgi:hypothetical protein